MPELRQNLATKEWVLIARERAKRPHQFGKRRKKDFTHMRPAYSEGCPFCPGREDQTPQTIMQLPEQGPWQARLFPNKFSALNPKGARVQCLEGVQRKISGVGYHEVVVESPLHNVTLALLPPEQIFLSLKCYRERGREIVKDPRVEHVIYFKNHGEAGGSSVPHPHSQLVALPMVPFVTRQRIAELHRAFDDEGGCPYCRMLEIELDQAVRVVTQNEFFVAIVPYAALSPFHLFILPRRHGPTCLDQSSEELMALASIMRELFGKIYHGLNDPDYNYMIRSAPVPDSHSEHLHWYVSIVPPCDQGRRIRVGHGDVHQPLASRGERAIPPRAGSRRRDPPRQTARAGLGNGVTAPLSGRQPTRVR